MSSAVTAADHLGAVPVTSILAPDNGNKVVAEWLRTAEAALLAECADIRTGTGGLNKMVLKAGDTMTGRLIVGTSTAGQNAIEATGNTSGAGVRGTGGASDGIGGVFLGGGTNGNALTATGAGTGFAAIFGGTAATATVPTRMVQVQSGGIQMTATSPNANIDPGADSTIWPQSINSSSCTITTDGAGNAAVQTAGFNVDTVTIFGTNQLVVAFKRTLPGSAYRVALGEYGPYKTELVNGSRANTGYTLKVWDIVGAAYVNLTTTAVTVFVTTTGF